MKTIGEWVLVIFIVLVFSVSSLAQEKIHLANGEWKPFVSENLKYYGVISQIISESFALEGVKVEFDFLPWGRGIDQAENGDIDGTLLWVKNPKREKKFYFSEMPILPSNLVFWHLKSYKFDWENIEDLKKVEIGGLVKAYYGEEFKKAEQSGDIYIERTPHDEMNFRKLLKKRIHVGIIELDVGYDILREHYTSAQAQLLTPHPKPLRSSYYYLLLSKKTKRNARMIKLFNQGFKKLKESGKVKQYFEESQEGNYVIKK